jgi:hypothetical protein
MTQTITSVAILGSRYTSGVQYRLFDGATLGALQNPTHLGGGIWRAVVELPDAGGEVRWFANAGAALLGVDVVGAVNPDIASTLALAQAFTLGRFKIDYPNSTATQYNPDGTVRKVFSLLDDQGNPAIDAQSAVDRVPLP